MNDGERAAPGPMLPAMQAASKARQHQLDAAAGVRSNRRPPATPQELALPLVNAVGYLVDAVVEMQNQITKLEARYEQQAEAILATAEVVEGHGQTLDTLRSLLSGTPVEP